MRKVHINGVEWKYEIGKRVVVIHPPVGKKLILSYEQLVGERNYKAWFDHMQDPDYDGGGIPILPSDIKKYIEENLK